MRALRFFVAAVVACACTRPPAPAPGQVVVDVLKEASDRDAGVPDTAIAAAAEPAPDAGQSGPLLDLATAVLSPDRAVLASIVEFRVHLWDAKTKVHLHELDDTMCEEVVFAPDGKTLFVGHVNSPPAAFDVRAPATGSSFELPKGIAPETDRGAGMLSVSKDGAWLLGRCNTIEVCLWSTKTGGGRMWTQPAKGYAPPTALAFDAAGKRILLRTETGASYELEVPSLRRLR